MLSQIIYILVEQGRFDFSTILQVQARCVISTSRVLTGFLPVQRDLFQTWAGLIKKVYGQTKADHDGPRRTTAVWEFG